jgi:hypothetical protein
MTFLLLMIEAYVRLIRHDVFMRKHDFKALYKNVKQFPQSRSTSPTLSTEQAGRALDYSCAFYWKQVLCLQRSAVLVQMLRTRGVPAKMVIGAQKLPFKAHAWVEVAGKIADDRLAGRETFLVLEVC